MKKIVTATDLGGAPFFKNDMREVFNSEIWAVIEDLMSDQDSSSYGVIMSGCVISANVSNFDITAGIVYLNGEFMRLSAATNQTFPKYIAPKTPTSDSRTFADGSTHAVVQTKEAELVSSAPGAGQYIEIADLTNANAFRFAPSAWTNLTLINGWASVGGSPVQYKWDRMKKVIYLRGILDAAGSSSAVFAETDSISGVNIPSGIIPIVRDDGTITRLNIGGISTDISVSDYNIANTYYLTGIVLPYQDA